MRLGGREDALQMLAFVLGRAGLCKGADLRMVGQKPVQQRGSAPMKAADKQETLGDVSRNDRQAG
jgi:hypothetical protein